MSKNIDVSQPIRLLDGKPLMVKDRDGAEGEEVPVILKTVLVNAVMDPKTEPKDATGDDRLLRLELAQMIYKAEKTVELRDTDIKILKEVVNKIHATLIVGRVYQLLDKNEG